MDDLACLKLVGILMMNFMFSFTVSNYSTDEIGLIKSSIASLRIFCSAYVLGYFILFFTSAQNFASVLPSRTQAKGYFIATSVLKWFVGALAFHCVAVFYGAALFRYVEETFMWSVLMSSLVILPSFMTEIEEIFLVLYGKGRGINLPSCTCCIIILTLLGAWVGAFTLPLDWDREWQMNFGFFAGIPTPDLITVWPIPCAAGAMMGHFISLLSSSILLCWKHRKRNKNKFI